MVNIFFLSLNGSSYLKIYNFVLKINNSEIESVFKTKRILNFKNILSCYLKSLDRIKSLEYFTKKAKAINDVKTIYNRFAKEDW